MPRREPECQPPARPPRSRTRAESLGITADLGPSRPPQARPARILVSPKTLRPDESS